jgi:hypothetical protein
MVATPKRNLIQFQSQPAGGQPGYQQFVVAELFAGPNR